MWFMEHREEIKNDNPGFSVVDISKKAGELWKGLSSDDKKVSNYFLALRFSGYICNDLNNSTCRMYLRPSVNKLLVAQPTHICCNILYVWLCVENKPFFRLYVLEKNLPTHN